MTTENKSNINKEEYLNDLMSDIKKEREEELSVLSSNKEMHKLYYEEYNKVFELLKDIFSQFDDVKVIGDTDMCIDDELSSFYYSFKKFYIYVFLNNSYEDFDENKETCKSFQYYNYTRVMQIEFVKNYKFNNNDSKKLLISDFDINFAFQQRHFNFHSDINGLLNNTYFKDAVKNCLKNKFK